MEYFYGFLDKAENDFFFNIASTEAVFQVEIVSSFDLVKFSAVSYIQLGYKTISKISQ